MKKPAAHNIELATTMLKRCTEMTDFISETVESHFGNHPYKESLQAVIERQDMILKAALGELTGEKWCEDGAGSAE